VAAAAVLREQRDFSADYRTYERAGEVCQKVPGGPHAEAIAAGNGIAAVMLLEGDATNAAASLTEVLDACRQRYRDDSPEAVAARGNLARRAARSRPDVCRLRRSSRNNVGIRSGSRSRGVRRPDSERALLTPRAARAEPR
jgi:hypothetical protein